MRIEALHLMAFGPFTDKVLDFSQGKEGFHLVYGNNEAGKSSALRALRCLLFGIPVRTQDDFIHPYARIRIGATLRSVDGKVLKLVRRKGRSHTLRGADDESIVDEKELMQFLKGIDEDLFSTMFGIGYEDLVRGGQEVMQGEGNLGRLIFSAGSGIANLREIQDELQEGADALFRASAQKPLINSMLSRFKDLRSALREAQLPGQEWERHHQSLTRALAEKESVAQTLATLQKTRNRCKRIQEALPSIARRNGLIKALGDLGTVRELPEGFSEKRQALMTALNIAEKEKEQASIVLKQNAQAVAALNVSGQLLEHAEEIEALHQELGSQRKAAKDSILLETRRDTLRGEAAEILRGLKREITVDEAEQLRIKKDQVVLIQELSGQYERIIARMEDIREKLPEIKESLAQTEAAFDNLPKALPVEELKTALSMAEAYGPLEGRSRDEQREIRLMLATLQKEHRRLGLDEKAFPEVESLPVPNMESIHLFEARWDNLMQSTKDIEKEQERIQSQLQDNTRQLESYRLEQDVPSEDDLFRIRSARDRGLALITAELSREKISEAALADYLQSFSQGDTLLEVFAGQMKSADEIADRLRREADRVAAVARMISDQKSYRESLEWLAKRMAAVLERKQLFEREWADLWQAAGINPRLPKEMIQWTVAFRAMIEKLEELHARRAGADRLTREIESHRSRLQRLLEALPGANVPEDGALFQLIDRAAAVLQKQTLLQERRRELVQEKKRMEKALFDGSLKLKTFEANLDRWQKQWEAAVKPIGLMADAMPVQAMAVIEELKLLFDKLKEADILQKRIQGIHRDEVAFKKRVDLLVETAAHDLGFRDAEKSVLELQNRLKQTRDARSRQETLEKQAAVEQQRLSRAKEKMALSQAELEQMCSEAECTDYRMLAEAEKLSDRLRRLKSELQAVDERLRQVSGGATVDEFVQEAAGVDADVLIEDIHKIEENINDMATEKSRLDQIIGREQNELEKMDGSAKAALIAEEIQFLSGGISDAVERYACLKIAGKMLSTAIERYRDKSQGPILERASRLFEQMTLGSFAALRADYDASGSPILVGVRPKSGEVVSVAGMSDGTADQLYLALRLAGMEVYLENNEPIPFIVDDILISFDNQRAAKALKVLAELSQKTQIIFFSHHRHLMELAALNLDASVLFQHTLE